MAVANPSVGGVTALLGKGDGTLRSPKNYHTGFATDIVMADLTGDGIPDLLGSGFELSLLIGNGDGTFQPALIYGHTGAPAALADFNLDGGIDLVTPIANSAVTVILHSQGTGPGAFSK